MDEDTKLVLEAWRGLLVENNMLRQRIVQLELEVRNVSRHTDDGWGSVPWRRVGLGRRGDGDSSD
jgi:hypothetical protein